MKFVVLLMSKYCFRPLLTLKSVAVIHSKRAVGRRSPVRCKGAVSLSGVLHNLYMSQHVTPLVAS